MENAENAENWPEEFMELKSIEESLTCGICYEFMETVVMTPCSHNYCSLCIRKYLNYKSECPACFNQVFDTDLRVNRTLDNIKQHFLKVRYKLKLCMKGIKPTAIATTVQEISTPVKSRLNQLASTQKTGNKSPSSLTRSEEVSTPVRSTRVNHAILNPHTPNRSSNKSAQDADSSMHLFSPSTSGIAPIFTNVKSKNLFRKEDPGPTVPCPVCTVNISETYINRHLDDCLKRESNTSGPITMETKLKALPKLVPYLMKDTELRRRLKEYGLSTAGDSKTLKTRLSKFHILYNAERDKVVQRSLAEMAKQCEDEEQIEKKVVLSNSGNMLAFNKSQIQKSQKGSSDNYCEANKNSFEKLIQQVKNRNTMKKAQATEESSDLTSGNEEQVSETAINVSNDSDSDSVSNLQRYSSDGPMQCLEVQYTEDENLKESCPQTSETDSAIDVNRVDDSTDADTTFSSPGKSEKTLKRHEEKLESPFASIIADTSNELEMDAQSPVLNKRPAGSEILEANSASSDSNLANLEKPKTVKGGKFSVKKLRMTKLNFDIGNSLSKNVPDIQALDQFLENKEGDLKDVFLDISDDSVASNTSKVAEEIEEPVETQGTKSTAETLPGLVNGDKENEPICAEAEKMPVPRSTRKRVRPSRYLEDEEYTPTKPNVPSKNVLHESTTFEVTLDGSLSDIVSPPEKVLKRRRGRSKTVSPSQVETPQRVLRRRLGVSSKSSLNNS